MIQQLSLDWTNTEMRQLGVRQCKNKQKRIKHKAFWIKSNLYGLASDLSLGLIMEMIFPQNQRGTKKNKRLKIRKEKNMVNE